MISQYLNCTAETSLVRELPATAAHWLARDVRPESWQISLGREAIDEIRRAIDSIENSDKDPFEFTPANFAFPKCSEVMHQMTMALNEGVGFGVLDRLPIDEYPGERLLPLYWVLGQFMGRPVAQKFNGQLIYHVHDSGKQFQYGVRGSHTSVELNFHTDNAFGQSVPDSVGLYCVAAAKSGGVSRFCSLYAVHQRLSDQAPNALQRLYQPMLFDRQKEHGLDEAPVTLAPFFSWRGDHLYARANASLVRKGYDVAGEPLDDELGHALEAIDSITTNEDLWFESPLEPGQIQYLNNHEIGHYRSEFVDHDESSKRRSLYRLWHRDTGSATYHGV